MADEQTDIPTNPTPDAPAAEAAPVVVDSQEGTILGGEAVEQQAEAPAVDEAATPVAVPEKYELTLPEGITLDAAGLELATPVFQELGLSNEQASKLAPVAAQWAQSIRDQGQSAMLAEVATQRAAWANEAKGDPEIGGANWDASAGIAAKALDSLGFVKGSPFRSLLNDSGLGNHPEMIRAFVRVGKAIGEDGDFVRGDAAAPVKSVAHTLYPNDTPKGAQ